MIKKNVEVENLQIVLKDVIKTYGSGELKVTALDGVSLTVKRGAFKMILGPSGSGKSTLLNILGGLDSADSGKILIKLGDKFEDIGKLSYTQLSLFRRKYLGFIFQFYNLIPIMTAKENIELAARFSDIENPKKSSKELLERLGLKGKENRYPNQLSGGEQQRVAVARALVKKPALILADEPSGNLDSKNSNEIYHLLKELSQEFNKTILVVTHDESMADKYATEHIHLQDGKIVEKNGLSKNLIKELV